MFNFFGGASKEEENKKEQKVGATNSIASDYSENDYAASFKPQRADTAKDLYENRGNAEMAGSKDIARMRLA